MAWVFLLDAIYEMLEIITVPLAAEPFHDVNPITGIAFPVFRKLVIASFPLAEQVGADEVQIRIVDVDFSGRDLIFHDTVGEFARD